MVVNVIIFDEGAAASLRVSINSCSSRYPSAVLSPVVAARIAFFSFLAYAKSRPKLTPKFAALKLTPAMLY